MLERLRRLSFEKWLPLTSWRRFVVQFVATFAGGVAATFLFIVLVDPLGVVAFSLPLKRAFVSINQRHMYPSLVRSGRFDSFIVGTSTAFPFEPDILNGPFQARFANIAVAASTAWEQVTILQLVARHVVAPKVVVIATDHVWCDRNADVKRHYRPDWPDWNYDDNPWNDYLYLLNGATLELAGRLVAYNLGLYRRRLGDDGFSDFTPRERTYELAAARRRIWNDRAPAVPPELPPPVLTETERQALTFPALPWLDEILLRFPRTTLKVIALMPVHVAFQPWPGTAAAAVDAECKARIAAIARKQGAKMIDWRLASPLTREDGNFWDNLHVRVPIAQSISRDLAAAVLEGREAQDGRYRIVVP